MYFSQQQIVAYTYCICHALCNYRV